MASMTNEPTPQSDTCPATTSAVVVDQQQQQHAGHPGERSPQRNQYSVRGISSGTTFFFVSASIVGQRPSSPS